MFLISIGFSVRFCVPYQAIGGYTDCQISNIITLNEVILLSKIPVPQAAGTKFFILRLMAS